MRNENLLIAFMICSVNYTNVFHKCISQWNISAIKIAEYDVGFSKILTIKFRKLGSINKHYTMSSNLFFTQRYFYAKCLQFIFQCDRNDLIYRSENFCDSILRELFSINDHQFPVCRRMPPYHLSAFFFHSRVKGIGIRPNRMSIISEISAIYARDVLAARSLLFHGSCSRFV